jgi:hypothetical protein
MIEELLSEQPVIHNWGFILFFLCFLITIRLLRKEKLLFSMIESVFRQKERQAVVNNELAIKLFLCLQTIVFSSISIYFIFNYFTGFSIDSASELFLFFGILSLLLLVFCLYKFLLNTLVGSVFFQKEQVRLWNDNFFTIISLSGLVLFIPTVLLFYFPSSFLFCFYFIVIYLLFTLILITYRIYVIFFHHKSALLYFILYLCAQEIVPLYFLYEVLVYLFNTMQMGIL